MGGSHLLYWVVQGIHLIASLWPLMAQQTLNLDFHTCSRSPSGPGGQGLDSMLSGMEGMQSMLELSSAAFSPHTHLQPWREEEVEISSVHKAGGVKDSRWGKCKESPSKQQAAQP